ncbi:class I SAM-dependent methyltransferase [Desulfosporosinus sp. FKA]|uniref:class I SAM-dependent methyltransferase n=1 Tax=Desulfosporosinus sp. FKA TaxID=1969834 RepID=UPI000B4A37AC|nr:class I SAM-dependent methyltransferase [Desulfosporosinus sp. FKA]
MDQSIPICLRVTQPDIELWERVQWFRRQPGCSWVDQQNNFGSLPELKISRRGVELILGGNRLAFHPNMALIRAINILRGSSDRFLDATQLKAGDSFLDATLGLASDALIGALAVGEGGHVLGLEKSPILTAVIQDGLMHLTETSFQARTEHKKKAWTSLVQAASRIDVRWTDHKEFLSCCPSKSIDVIYFDPMFRRTFRESDGIQPLHQWSEHSPLDQQTVKDACRVARKRVVLKERKDSREFNRLGFKLMSGGRYSSVDYGLIII